MDQPLIETLEKRRLDAGKGGKPLGYKAWGAILGVMYTSLWKFANGKGSLGIEALRHLAQIAKVNNDNEMIEALVIYALGVEVSAQITQPVDN